MFELLSQPQFQVIALAVFVGLFVLTVLVVTTARFYRRCGADEALVRTGAGGNKVIIGGGMTVYPIFHQLLRVPLRSIKLSVERSARNALVTKDKIKANVTTELYLKVEPLVEDVLAAARSFGERNLGTETIGELIEGKLTDALRSVAANSTFMDLHTQRKQFAESIQTALSEELKKNGLTLENVSITALAMVPVKDLDPQDVFDAEGLRAITDSVQSNAEKTNQIQREKELAIKFQNVDARKRALSMEQDQAHAEADQERRVSEYSATQRAEQEKVVQLQAQAIALAHADRARVEREAQIDAEKRVMAAEILKQRELEAATIEKQKAVQAAEIDRQKALEAATIEKQKVIEASEIMKEQTVETARIGKVIAVTQSEEQAARAAALKAQAQAEEERATQEIMTVEAKATAEREKAIAVIKAEEAAQQSRIAAEREAYRLKLEAETRAAAVRAQAEGEAQAKRAAAEGEVSKAKGSAEAQQLAAEASASVVRTEMQAEADRVRVSAEARALAAQQEAEALKVLAEATLKKGEADADARRKLIEAENMLAQKFLLRDVALKALDVLPAVTRELMSPAKAISEIKVLQMNGMNSMGDNSANGGASSGNAFGVASPVLKTILEAGAAYPLLREMMQFSQVDGDKLANKARSLLNALPNELRAVIDADPELGAKVSAFTGASGSENAGIVVQPIDANAKNGANGAGSHART